MFPRHPRNDEVLTLKRKIQAFKTIYRALFDVADQLYSLKHEFIVGKECLTDLQYVGAIEAHIERKKTPHAQRSSKVRYAWALANVYYNDCREDNVDLVSYIYHHARKYGLQNGARVFRHHRKMIKLTPEQIKNAHRDKVLFLVCHNLANPIPPLTVCSIPRAEMEQRLGFTIL